MLAAVRRLDPASYCSLVSVLKSLSGGFEWDEYDCVGAPMWSIRVVDVGQSRANCNGSTKAAIGPGICD